MVSVDEIISTTLPKRHGERNMCILRFARGLRFEAALQDSAFRDLRPLVKKWHVAALPFINTRDFDETWADFIRAWDRAQVPLSGMLDAAWKTALSEPMPAEASAYDNPLVQQLVALCRALSAHSPDGHFFLSMHSAATLLNVKPMRVLRWLRMMQVDGIIELLLRGDHRVSRAGRYRWF